MLEQRADCEYYVPRHYRLLNALNCAPFQLKRLRDITSHIVDGPFGSAIKAEDYAECGIPFIRVADVTRGEGTIRTDDMVFITREAHGKILRSKAIPDDVIIAKTGATMGAASVLPKNINEANIRGDLALVGSLGNPLHAQYLSTYINTSIGYRLFWRLNSGSTRGRVVISNLRKLPVLWPDDEVQRQVVSLIELGRKAMQKKELEAKRLLASIDDYLLAELGITLPPEPENTIANRIFTAQRRELAGWRFDPLFHSFKLWHAIEAAHIPHKKLGLCCHYLKSGFAAGGDMQLFDNEGIIQLRPTNIDSDRELVFDRNVYLDKALLLDRDGDVVQVGEVLFNNTNSQELVGKTVCMDIEGQPFFCSNHITRIMVNEDHLNAKYLTALLNTYQRLKVFFSLCTNWNNQSGVNVDLLRQLPIPVPDIGKQTAIATHIGKIRQEAKRLRQQAATELEAAKRRIEAMLLGEQP